MISKWQRNSTHSAQWYLLFMGRTRTATFTEAISQESRNLPDNKTNPTSPWEYYTDAAVFKTKWNNSLKSWQAQQLTIVNCRFLSPSISGTATENEIHQKDSMCVMTSLPEDCNIHSEIWKWGCCVTCHVPFSLRGTRGGPVHWSWSMTRIQARIPTLPKILGPNLDWSPIYPYLPSSLPELKLATTHPYPFSNTTLRSIEA